MTKLTELIALADAATPGPWGHDKQRALFVLGEKYPIAHCSTLQDAMFISACDPATVKRMDELLMQCREALEKALWVERKLEQIGAAAGASDEAMMLGKLSVFSTTLAALDAFEKEGE